MFRGLKTNNSNIMIGTKDIEPQSNWKSNAGGVWKICLGIYGVDDGSDCGIPVKVGALMNLESLINFCKSQLLQASTIAASLIKKSIIQGISSKRNIRGILPASIHNCCMMKIFITIKGRPLSRGKFCYTNFTDPVGSCIYSCISFSC